MDKRTSLTFDLIEPFRQQIVDKSMIALINRKQITKMDIDKRNNLIKLDARRIIANKIFSKLYSTITYNEESLTYADIIRKQSDNLVKTLLYNQKFESLSSMVVNIKKNLGLKSSPQNCQKIQCMDE